MDRIFLSLSFYGCLLLGCFFFPACCSRMYVVCLVSTIVYACVDINTIPNGNAYIVLNCVYRDCQNRHRCLICFSTTPLLVLKCLSSRLFTDCFSSLFCNSIECRCATHSLAYFACMQYALVIKQTLKRRQKKTEHTPQ